MIDGVLSALLDLLEIALLVTAFLITVTPSVQQVIQIYRLQASVLAVAVGLTALIKLFEAGVDADALLTIILIILIVILPILLALLIEPILVRATIAVTSLRPWPVATANDKRVAVRMWRKNEDLSSFAFQHAFFFIGLVGLAFLVAFKITSAFSVSEFSPSGRVGLMVSLSLHLGGLYNMIFKRDIISQVIGLLIMDHGLYLAVVKIVAIPVPATFFVVSLYFYTLITIVILVFLLPQIRQQFLSIDLDDIAKQSTLKG